MSTYEAQIDYRDISSLEILKLVSEKALQSENNFIKNAYKYDYLIQVNFNTINGLRMRDHKDKTPIANVFIKVKIFHLLVEF